VNISFEHSKQLGELIVIEQVNIDAANDISLQLAAKTCGIDEWGIRYENALYVDKLTAKQKSLLRVGLRNCHVVTLPQYERNDSGIYPWVSIVFE
jgi:hypothetical protein